MTFCKLTRTSISSSLQSVSCLHINSSWLYQHLSQKMCELLQNNVAEVEYVTFQNVKRYLLTIEIRMCGTCPQHLLFRKKEQNIQRHFFSPFVFVVNFGIVHFTLGKVDLSYSMFSLNAHYFTLTHAKLTIDLVLQRSQQSYRCSSRIHFHCKSLLAVSLSSGRRSCHLEPVLLNEGCYPSAKTGFPISRRTACTKAELVELTFEDHVGIVKSSKRTKLPFLTLNRKWLDCPCLLYPDYVPSSIFSVPYANVVALSLTWFKKIPVERTHLLRLQLNSHREIQRWYQLLERNSS